MTPINELIKLIRATSETSETSVQHKVSSALRYPFKLFDTSDAINYTIVTKLNTRFCLVFASTEKVEEPREARPSFILRAAAVSARGT